MFQHILCAYDATPSSRAALRQSFDLAEAFNARLTVAAVAPDVPSFAYASGVDVGSLQRGSMAEAEKHVREAADAAPKGIGVQTVIRSGHPGEQLVTLMSDLGADLVVMGTRGRGRLASTFLGTTAGAVHFHGDGALLVVHADEDEAPAVGTDR